MSDQTNVLAGDPAAGAAATPDETPDPYAELDAARSDMLLHADNGWVTPGEARIVRFLRAALAIDEAP